MKAKPFLKWAGGKRSLLPEIRKHLPEREGASLMLSNSDTGDGFFDELYAGYTIERVRTRSTISCRGDTRRVRNEVLITNY